MIEESEYQFVMDLLSEEFGKENVRFETYFKGRGCSVIISNGIGWDSKNTYGIALRIPAGYQDDFEDGYDLSKLNNKVDSIKRSMRAVRKLIFKELAVA